MPTALELLEGLLRQVAELRATLHRQNELMMQLMEHVEERPALLTPKQAAWELSVSVTVVRRLIKRKRLKTVFVGERRRVPLSEIYRIAPDVRLPELPRRPPTAEQVAAREQEAAARYDERFRRLRRGFGGRGWW